MARGHAPGCKRRSRDGGVEDEITSWLRGGRCGILRLAHAYLARVKSINVKTGMYTTLRQEEQSRTSLGN